MAEVRPGVTRLTAGYVLNAAETDIDHVRVSLQHDLDRLVYSFKLDAEPQIKSIPSPTPTPPESPRPRIIPTEPGSPRIGEQ